MNQLPEEFHWDAILIKLQCENKFLLETLMPLKVSDLESLDLHTSILPAIIKKNITYKQRLDFEKKIEHLPIKIFWAPTSSTPLTHFKYWAKKNVPTNWLFPFTQNDGLSQETLIKEISSFKEQYEAISYESSNITDVVGFSQFTEGSCFSKEEALHLIETAQQNLNQMVSWVWLKDGALSPSRIEFVDQQKRIDLEDEFFINLTQPEVLSEDFHVIIPDRLIRIIYACSIQLKLTDAIKRMNTTNFPQSIFKMPVSLLNNWNQWVKVKELNPVWHLSHNDKESHNSSKITINNQASGSGVLITWKFEHEALPLYRLKTFFSTEMVEILVKATKNLT